MEDKSTTKRCPLCSMVATGEEQMETFFLPDLNQPDGRMDVCKWCAKNHGREIPVLPRTPRGNTETVYPFSGFSDTEYRNIVTVVIEHPKIISREEGVVRRVHFSPDEDKVLMEWASKNWRVFIRSAKDTLYRWFCNTGPTYWTRWDTFYPVEKTFRRVRSSEEIIDYKGDKLLDKPIETVVE